MVLYRIVSVYHVNTQYHIVSPLPGITHHYSIICTTRARVAGTEVCGCHRGRKLIFITVEIDF